MSLVMERIRLVILTDDEIRAALRLYAAKQDKEMSEAATDILRESLADEIQEIRERKRKK